MDKFIDKFTLLIVGREKDMEKKNKHPPVVGWLIGGLCNLYFNG